jgi:hypothetical protein
VARRRRPRSGRGRSSFVAAAALLLLQASCGDGLGGDGGGTGSCSASRWPMAGPALLRLPLCRQWLLAAAGCCHAAATLAATPQAPPTGAMHLTATISLDAAPAAFPHFWEASVGSSHAAMGLRADWRAHLKMATRDCGFKAVRMHGIFDDDMSVVFPPCTFPPCKDHGGTRPPPTYSWYTIHRSEQPSCGCTQLPISHTFAEPSTVIDDQVDGQVQRRPALRFPAVDRCAPSG